MHVRYFAFERFIDIKYLLPTSLLYGILVLHLCNLVYTYCMCSLFLKEKASSNSLLSASPPSFLPPPNKRAFSSSSLSSCVVSPDVPGQGGGGRILPLKKLSLVLSSLLSLCPPPPSPPGGLIYRQRGKTDQRTGGARSHTWATGRNVVKFPGFFFVNPGARHSASTIPTWSLSGGGGTLEASLQPGGGVVERGMGFKLFLG